MSETLASADLVEEAMKLRLANVESKKRRRSRHVHGVASTEILVWVEHSLSPIPCSLQSPNRLIDDIVRRK